MNSRRLAIVYLLLLLPLLLAIPAFVNVPDQLSAQRPVSNIGLFQATRPPAPTPISYTLTISIVGSGTVAKNPDYTSYASGTVVQLTASPAAGWQFSSWSSNVTGSGTTVSIVMDGNKTVDATFTNLFTNTPTRTPTNSPTATLTVRPPTSTSVPALATVTLAPAATSVPTTTPAPATITPLSSVATITPLSSVATSTPVATVTPIPASALPTTGMTFTWVLVALALVLVVVGARYLRQSSN